MNGFTFGDDSSWNYDLHVQRSPALSSGMRRVQSLPIVGRNGNLQLQEDAFDNFQKAYDCYFHGNMPTPAQAHAIKSWLCRGGTYQRLEDTYDPDYFYLACFNGPLDIDNRFNRYGICTIYFDCDPRAFRKDGEIAEEFSTSGVIFNPTSFHAKPLITVTGTGPGNLYIGSFQVAVKAITDPIILDCETQHAYSKPGQAPIVNQNGNILSRPFPELVPGENRISFDGGLTGVSLIPRWWEL